MAKRRTVITLIVLAGLAVVVKTCINRMDTYYSSRFVHLADSLSEAARRAVLIRPVVLTDTALIVGDVSVALVEAWIEQSTHREYRWLVLGRTVRDDRFHLVVRLGPARSLRTGHVLFSYDPPLLVYGDSTTIGESNGSVRYREVRPPFPDSLRLRFVRPEPGTRRARR